MAGKATEKRTESTEAVRPYVNMIEQLQSRAQLDRSASSSFDIASQVIDKIQEAETLDDLFDAVESGTTSLRDAVNLHNVPVNVYDVRYVKAAERFKENSLGVFVIIDLVTDAGEAYTLSTGAPNVVAFLYKAQTKGLLNETTPLRVRFTSRETENGYLLSVARP